MYNERLSEQLSVVACIDPDAYGTGTENSDIIDLRYHRRVLFIITVGDLASTATVDFKVFADTAANMATEVEMTDKGITQLTEAGTDSNKQVIVEVTAEEVAALGDGYRYIRGKLIVGTATCDAGVVALADFSRYSPASEFDLASVDEIVA